MDYSTIIKHMSDGILAAIDQKIYKARFNKMVKGIVIGNGMDGVYKIQLNGVLHDIYSDFHHIAGDIVMICIPNNNYNEKFIISGGKNGIPRDNILTQFSPLPYPQNNYSITELQVSKLGGWCRVYCQIKPLIAGTAAKIEIASSLPAPASITNVWRPLANNATGVSIGMTVEESTLYASFGALNGVYQVDFLYPYL